MNRKSLLLLPAALLSGVAMAETVSPEQALDRALSFFQQPARARGQQAAQSLTLAHTAQANGETYYYVFNNPAGGYVIVGGDDVAHSVLAYSESGTFDIDNLAPATRWWLGQYQNQIHSAIVAERQGIAMRRAATRGGEEAWPEVQPLLGGIEWNQGAPYNAYIFGSGEIADQMEQYCTGCAATALTQVMRYWKYPERGMAHHSYGHANYELEANFAESEYQWDLMLEKYPKSYSGTPEENAVAKLMSDVGIALNMKYGQFYTMGSGSPDWTILYALQTYFGYSHEMTLLSRDKFALPDGAWEQIVYGELYEKRPVIYTGANPEGGGGHCFVCDGYKDGFFHINWGWGGKANQDYYLLTPTATRPALDPKEEGAGGNGLGLYGGSQSIVIGVQPEPESEGYLYISEFVSMPREASYGPLHFEGKLHNPTSQDMTVLVGLIMEDPLGINSAEHELIEKTNKLTIPAQQEVTFSLDVPQEELIPGITYDDFFILVDVSDPEIPEEYYGTLPTMIMCIQTTHIEGPEYVWLNMSPGIATLSIPFDAELPEGVEAYTAESISDNMVNMKQAYSIEAGNSYLLLSEPIEEPILLSGMKATDDVWSMGPVFKGNMSSQTQYHPAASYIVAILEDDSLALVRNASGREVNPHRVIIDGSLAEADILRFNFEDSPTGIQQVSERSSSLRFNLMGQPQHAARGLMIEGGRISFVK